MPPSAVLSTAVESPSFILFRSIAVTKPSPCFTRRIRLLSLGGTSLTQLKPSRHSIRSFQTGNIRSQGDIARTTRPSLPPREIPSTTLPSPSQAESLRGGAGNRSVPVVRLLLVAALSAVIGFAMAATPALQTANEMLSPPTDEETLLLYQPPSDHPSAEINEFIMKHPLTKRLLADKTFSASRPHLKIPHNLRTHNFTGGTLLGDEKIPVPPLTFSTPNGSALVSIQYLGHALCGHPGIVHGGLLATLLDEGLARCCFAALPHKVGVTASLKVEYRKPCRAGQYVVLKAETTKVEGRKAWVKGRLEVLNADGTDGDILVEAEALFIEPRHAASMARLYSGQVGLDTRNGDSKAQVNGATIPSGVQTRGTAESKPALDG